MRPNHQPDSSPGKEPGDLDPSLMQALTHTLLDGMTEAVAVRDVHGKFLLVNAACAALFQRSATDLLGLTAADLLPPDEAAAIAGDVQRVFASGLGEVNDRVYTLAGGHPRRFRATMTPLRAGAGSVFAVASVGRDVSNEQPDEAMRATLAAIIDFSEDAIFTLKMDGTIESWNTGAVRTFGYSAQEAIGQSVFMLTLPEGEDEERQVLQRLKNGERIHYYEAPRRRKDGRIVVVSIAASLLRNTSGQMIGISKIARDVTEKRRAEEEREQFFSLSIDLLCIANTDGYFKRVNPAFRRVLGHTLEELTSKPFLDFVHPDDLPATLAEVAKLAAGATTIAFENRYRCKDGSYKWLSWKSSPDTRTGNLYAAARDVTEERRRAEELRALTLKLQRSNRELQDFASIASHDLQEPLRKIRTFGGRVIAKLGDSADTDLRNYLQRMNDSATRMQDLIDSLLTYSRVTSKAKPPVNVSLNEVLKDVLADLETRIEQSKGHVEISALPFVLADPTQMRQLFQNLISNALKFRRPEVPPTVKVFEQNGEIYVEDNGIGFEQQYAERIFGVFQRLHGRSEYEGNGIGLSICRKIVERHGGTIEARGTPGVGCTFVVALPLESPKGES